MSVKRPYEPGWYILDGKRAVPVSSIEEWAAWSEKAYCDSGTVVGRWDRGDGVRVSTVFLGLDHNFGSGPPMLFETMIFGGRHDQRQWRFSTWEEAEAHHMAMCRVLSAETRQSTTNEDEAP